MRTKLSRRLAGCIVIELLLAIELPGADFQYKAGVSSTAHVRALAIEDRRGTHAVIAEADFPITRALSDFVAARLLESYQLDRAGVVFRGVGTGTAHASELFTAISGALWQMKPAEVRYLSTVSITSVEGGCLAAITPDAAMHFDGCADGGMVSGPIHAAFQMVEPEHALLARSQVAPTYPVQAIAIGKLTLLALPGAYAVHTKDVMLLPGANDVSAPPDSRALDAAIRRLLARVR